MGDFIDIKNTDDQTMEDFIIAYQAWYKERSKINKQDTQIIKNFATYFMRQIEVQPGPHNHEILKKLFG